MQSRYRCTCAVRWPTCTCTTRHWRVVGTWSSPGSRWCCTTAARRDPGTSRASRYYSWNAARASRCGRTPSTTWPRTRCPAKGSTPCACRRTTPSWLGWVSTAPRPPISCGRTSTASRPTRRTSGCPAPVTGRNRAGNRSTDRPLYAGSRTSRTSRNRAASSTSPTSRWPTGPGICRCRTSCPRRCCSRWTPAAVQSKSPNGRETARHPLLRCPRARPSPGSTPATSAFCRVRGPLYARF